MKRILLLGLMLVSSAAAARANESRYTDFDIAKCQSIGEVDEETGSVSLKCGGLDEYPVYFKEGDVRQTTFFGHLNQAYIDNAFESFGTFNHTAKKIEWRIGADGKPVAAILRYFIEHFDPQTGMPRADLYGQILVVSKVAQKQDGLGCVIAYIDALANRDANELARMAADELSGSFVCGKDHAEYRGVRGEKADEPMRSLPE